MNRNSVMDTQLDVYVTSGRRYDRKICKTLFFFFFKGPRMSRYI